MLPVVLHHGFLGFGNISVGSLRIASAFPQIDRAIVQRGHPLVVTRVHPTGGIERRARQLKEQLLRQLNVMGRDNQPFVLMGHSMGGLDARYLITHLGMAEQVRALITVCTPHRGSPWADWTLRNLGQRLGGARLVGLLRIDMQAVADLTTTACARFNESVPDDPRVSYYSISAARPWNAMPPWALPAWKTVYDAEGDNDGLVSVRSATWGKHLARWDADHWYSCNRRFARGSSGDITPLWLDALSHVIRELEQPPRATARQP